MCWSGAAPARPYRFEYVAQRARQDGRSAASTHRRGRPCGKTAPKRNSGSAASADTEAGCARYPIAGRRHRNAQRRCAGSCSQGCAKRTAVLSIPRGSRCAASARIRIKAVHKPLSIRRRHGNAGGAAANPSRRSQRPMRAMASKNPNPTSKPPKTRSIQARTANSRSRTRPDEKHKLTRQNQPTCISAMIRP